MKKNKIHETPLLKSVLIIAGSDSGAGAGIQADIKSCMAHNVYATTVITSITAQNTLAVAHKYALSNRTISKQLTAIFNDFDIEYVKIGMLCNLRICKIVYKFLKTRPNLKIILDPVMISKSHFRLLSPKCIKFLKYKFIPICYLITPNIEEAEILGSMSGIQSVSQIKELAKEIHKLGCKNILIKGGHLPDNFAAIDILYSDNQFYQISAKRWSNNFTHGTGCSLSSTIVANLYNGLDLLESIKRAKTYVNKGISMGKKYGHGINPINHFINSEDS